MTVRGWYLHAWDYYVFHKRQRNQLLTRQTLSDAGKRGAWRRWHREQSIIRMLPTVEKIARDVRWMFSPTIDISDLTQAGAIGLCKAAAAYEPARAGTAGFDSYAWFRVRGAIIDSQKRRAYREEQNDSLDRWVAGRRGGGGAEPPTTLLDTIPDPAPLTDEELQREEIRRALRAAIGELPDVERAILQAQMDGRSLTATAQELGRSVNWTRQRLAAARETVGAAVRPLMIA